MAFRVCFDSSPTVMARFIRATYTGTAAAWGGPEKRGHDGGGRYGRKLFRYRVNMAGRSGLGVIPLVALAFLLLAAPVFAVEPSERLGDPALEARARAISGELRCLVCQNESIDESGASLAHDIRVFLRERLSAGDSDAQAMGAVVSRYGDFVLLRPPVKPATWLLWFGPVTLLGLGFVGTVVWLRRRPVVPPAPLSAAEQAELAKLMKDEG